MKASRKGAKTRRNTLRPWHLCLSYFLRCQRGLVLWLILTTCWLPACAALAPLPTQAAPAPLATHTPIHPPTSQPTIEATIPATNTPAHPHADSPTPSPTQSPIPDGTSTDASSTNPQSPCSTPGQIQTGTLDNQLAGATAYRIYRPPCYGQDGRFYPTLYLLPGNIHSDAVWDELGIDEAADTAILAQAIPPLLIVMPNGGPLANNTSGGPNSYEALILDELIPFIEATTCAWPDAAGRAIGGLSRGGYWALEIAFRHPDHFASVGGHSAALLDTQVGTDMNPQHTGLTNDLGDLRIYFDIGRDDYLIANIQRLHEEMAAAGVAHTWALNDGRHENAYWSAHLADYLAWYTAPWPEDRNLYPPCQ